MGIVVDSSVLIAVERGRLSLVEHVAGQEQESVVLSALTASELLHGVYRAEDQQRKLQRERFVEGILARFPVVEFGIDTARVHARLWAELAARGEPVGAHDLIIAATAISLDFQVATANARDYQRIPGLRVQVWGR